MARTSLVCAAVGIFSLAVSCNRTSLAAEPEAAPSVAPLFAGRPTALLDGADFRIIELGERAASDGFARCRQLVQETHEAGKRCIIGLGGGDRNWCRRPLGDLIRDADAALGALDLREVHAILLGRETVPWDGGLEALNALYAHVTERYGLPVYQWVAAPLPPNRKQLADGWVVSGLGLPREAFRNYLVKYLITGKPVLVLHAEGQLPVADAFSLGEGAGPTAQSAIGDRKSEMAPLAALCRDLCVPASFLGAVGGPTVEVPHAPVAGSGSSEPATALAARSLESLWRHLPTEADRTEGQPIEMGGDRVFRYEYRDTFDETWCVDDAAIEGLSCLRWGGPEPALQIEGHGPQRQRVSLTYRFTAPYEAKELVAYAEGVVRGDQSDRVELSMSANGRDFIHPARVYGRPGGQAFHLTSTASYQFDSTGFWVRIAADLAPGSHVALGEFRAVCRLKPPGRSEVVLAPDAEGRLTYCDTLASRRILHLAEVDNAQALQWRRGGVLLGGRDGSPVQVAIRQRFVVPCALRSVVVRVRHAVSQREGGGTNSFGLSLDGRTVVASRTTPGAEGAFAGVTELRLDDSAALAEARQFFLHVTLTSGTGRAPSNVLSGVEVEARSAQAASTVAASVIAPTHP